MGGFNEFYIKYTGWVSRQNVELEVGSIGDGLY